MNSTKKSAKKNSSSANYHVNTSKLASEASSKSVLPDNSVSKIDTPTSNASQSTPVAEQDHCIICTEPISIYAFGSCNHRQCHLCALRLRALYKSKSCSYCKTDQASLIFTTDATTPYESFDLQSMQENSDKKLSIFCENKDVYAELLMLLRFNCPHEDCEVSCPGGWGELKKHVKDVHKLVMCDLCTRHKKVFTHEHTLFTHQQLQKHIKDGDPNDPSFKGHPNCGFCRTNFYDSDELYDHCKQKHEQCFLCVRSGIRHQYYVDYNSLEEHFKDDHYYCRKPQCVEKKFVVFATDIDFKAHELEEHSESSGGKKKSVQVDANFIYNSPSRSGSSGTRGNRNNNNNNADSNSQPILVVSERRDPRREFPRLGENTSSSSDSLTTNEVTTPARKNKAPPPGFGSELTESNSNTSTNTTTASIAQQLQQSQSTNSPRLRPPPGFGSQLTKEDFPLPSATTSTPTTQVTETVIPNEPELQTRIRKLFQMDASNFTEFKTHTAGYRRGDLTAAALFSKFRDYALVNRVGKVDKSETEVEMGKVWIKMAESFPPDDGGGEDKRAEMLRVLNDWKPRKTHENSFPVPKPNINWTTNSSSSSTPAKVLVIKPGSNAPAPRRNAKTYTSSNVSANRRPPLSTAPINKTLRTMTLVDSAPSLNNSSAGNGSVWTDEDFPPPPSVKVPARDQFEDVEEEEREKSCGSGKKKGKKGKQLSKVDDYIWHRLLSDSDASPNPINFARKFYYHDEDACKRELLSRAEFVYGQYYKTITTVAKRDRVDQYYNSLRKYNFEGVEWKQFFLERSNKRKRENANDEMRTQAYEKQAIFGAESVEQLKSSRAVSDRDRYTTDDTNFEEDAKTDTDFEQDTNQGSDEPINTEAPRYIENLGKSETGVDIIIANVNCTELLQEAIRNNELAQNSDKNSLFSHVTLKAGLLIKRHLPEEYADLGIDEEDYERLYDCVAPEQERLWNSICGAANDILAEVEEVTAQGIVSGKKLNDLDLPELPKDVSTMINSIYSHLSFDPPKEDSEASYCSKFVAPHFERISASLGRKCKVYVDTTLSDSKRPDLTVKFNQRPGIILELRIATAIKKRQLTQPWEAFERAREFLKNDMKNWDWGDQYPEIWTCFSQDGVHYHVYKLQLRGNLCLFIEMGLIQIFDSFLNLTNLTRAISGIDKFIEIMKGHEKKLMVHRRILKTHKSPNLPETPDGKRIKRETDSLIRQSQRRSLTKEFEKVRDADGVKKTEELDSNVDDN